MKVKLPDIKETADELARMMKAQPDPRLRQRLHCLYLLKSGQARTILQVAALLGVGRNAVGSWLATYKQGGCQQLLLRKKPSGRPPTLDPATKQKLRDKLREPQGFAGYAAIQAWLLAECQVQINYKTLHKVVRYELQARPKVVRPTHIKKA
jgi:transposase